eukprot:CAMPEP_0195032960 /NCGR_PEP_ID=MMETSP0326_2-20130528/64571_1 /TAXON_ID=2866 ORGANISM="Crypthecodinium cohnii, Strain Seligo" /NCGR_SAMPLE_ID=MMETSP0326_2 /ASSEMBLY_ACC=CAM_ASM_000348 /LENGTH=97 /DNA_ID=CAMNT_0040057245 /DNA_START=31 /DNA_END=322 /DNA_ORIENTATION=-
MSELPARSNLEGQQMGTVMMAARNSATSKSPSRTARTARRTLTMPSDNDLLHKTIFHPEALTSVKQQLHDAATVTVTATATATCRLPAAGLWSLVSL